MKKSANKNQYGTFVIIVSTLLILLTLCINLLALQLPSSIRRIDLTDLKLSKLSNETVDYLKVLSDEITIAHICITGEEEETISDMLEKYAECSDKIKIKQVDPAVNPSFVAKYSDGELENNSLIVISSKRAKVVNYYDMFTFDLYYTDNSGNTVPQGEMSYSDFQTFYDYYSSYFGTVYSYDTLFAGEAVTTSAIDYAVSEVLPKIYEVTGHGESALSDTVVSALNLDNIELEQLSIVSSGIPDDADSLIINGPVTDLSENESQQLSSYLEKGGNLILLTDSEHLDLPNLLEVTNKYGLSAQKGYVCENSGHFLGQTYMTLPDISVASQTLGISGYSVVMPLAHSVSYKKTDNVAYLEMFKSSDMSYLVDEISDGENTGEDDLERSAYCLGVLATFTASEGRTSRIMWISSSAFASDEINSYSTGGNYLYLLTLIEKMTGKSSNLTIASKKFVEDSLVISFAQVCFWTVIFCALIPLSVLLASLYINRRRRMR